LGGKDPKKVIKNLTEAEVAKIHVGLILEDAGLLQAILENEGFSVIDLSQRELISARDADAFIVRVPD